MWLGNSWIALVVVAVAHSYLAAHRLLAYLRYFQQEGYEAIRFAKWAKFRSLTDPAFWLSGAASLLAARYTWGAIATFAAGAMLLAWVQPDPRRTGKIQLKMTWRATRVLLLAVLLASGLWVVAPAAYSTGDLRAAFFASMVVFATLPLALVVANWILAPYEQHVRNEYEREAVQRIADVAPFIVGITGSYGKSSSKSMLAHILQFKAPTLAASGSVNTLMGITRHIREELVFGQQFMVVEMGAFKTGSIRRLCQLTPPSAGLITAVGDMHLERFGSTEEIVRAKSELAEALPEGGLLVVNADSPGALRIARASTHRRVLLYGETSPEDLETRLEQVSFSKRGTTFVLRTRDRSYACFTPLLGRPIVLNLAGAFTLAAAAGVDPDVIVASLRTLKPVSNRLEVVEERGVTWIKDAYNSNQFGFRAALEVAGALPVARRILATPGVIELGKAQFDVNRALSKEAATVCDTTLIVADTNREAFVAGHRDAGREGALVTVASRRDAFRWMRENVQAGDAVILENDLPDLYEDRRGVLRDGSRNRMNHQRTIGVLLGGRSLEHDVSVVSGLQICQALDPARFIVVPIYIDHATRWWIGEDLWRTENYKGGGPDRSRLTEVMLSPGFGTSTLVPVPGSSLPLSGAGSSQPIDVFLPVLHGTLGEDGSIQGLFDLGGCAYVGCGVLASAIGMNKRVTKVMAAQAGVPIVPYLSCDRGVLERDASWVRDFPARVADAFGWPVIVKPCNLGSSAGVTVAATPEDLLAGVLKVFEYDLEAIIEPFIKNRLELNVAVAGLDEPVASVTEMPVTEQASPLTFSEKYKREGGKSIGSSEGMAGALRVLDPQDLPAELRARAQLLATTVFSVPGCEGISRIDFLINADTGELFFNEINTLPGSLAFYLWSAAPHYWTITDLLARLIERAERIRATRRGLQRRPPPDLQLLG